MIGKATEATTRLALIVIALLAAAACGNGEREATDGSSRADGLVFIEAGARGDLGQPAADTWRADSTSPPQDADSTSPPQDAGVAPPPPQVLLENLANPQLALALDEKSVYVGTNISVVKVDKDGSNRLELTEWGGTQRGLAVDDTHIFWCNSSGVHRTDNNGGAYTLLAAAGKGASFLALDATHVFWGDYGFGYEQAKLSRVAKDGSGEVVLVPDPPLGSFSRRVAVDATHLYWLNPSAGTVTRAKKDGSEIEIVIDESIVNDFQLEGDKIYYSGPATKRANKDGSNVQLLSLGTGSMLAVDEEAVYWVSSSNSLVKVDKDGSAPTLIADLGRVVYTPGAIAVDEHWAYIINQGGAGTLVKVAK